MGMIDWLLVIYGIGSSPDDPFEFEKLWFGDHLARWSKNGWIMVGWLITRRWSKNGIWFGFDPTEGSNGYYGVRVWSHAGIKQIICYGLLAPPIGGARIPDGLLAPPIGGAHIWDDSLVPPIGGTHITDDFAARGPCLYDDFAASKAAFIWWFDGLEGRFTYYLDGLEAVFMVFIWWNTSWGVPNGILWCLECWNTSHSVPNGILWYLCITDRWCDLVWVEMVFLDHLVRWSKWNLMWF